MLALLRSVWIWVAATALILFWVPLLGIVRLTDRHPLRLLTARWFRRLGRAMARVNPWRIHILGAGNIDPRRTYVVVSNHQSLADIPLLAHLELDTKWLGKSELFRIPILGWMMRAAGDVPVERGNPRKAAQALLQCGRYLKQGCSVVFFPEGTRSRTGEVLPFNEGPFQLAIRERVAVLPIAIEGSYALIPKDSWLFSGTCDITVSILAPVSTEGQNVKQTAALRDTVRQGIVDEIDRIRAVSPAGV